MKFRLLWITGLLIPYLGASQNLVLNPGLENYVTCPGFGQFGPAWVTDWYKPSVGSSDYYHFNCPTNPPPTGANPRTGNGEGGIILYNYGTEYREYVTATLSQPLIAGKAYYVEFYLALNPGYIQAVEEAGAYLSDSVHGPFPNALTINVVPQVKNVTGFLSYGWNKISGYMTAAGGETYITIGNFMNDSNTTTSNVGTVGSYGAYYFIDDVLVSGTDSTSTGIESLQTHKNGMIPGLVNRSLPVNIAVTGHETLKISIYQSTGALSVNFEVNEASRSVSFEKMSPGIYFYTVRSKNNLLSTGKFILQ